MKHTAIRAVIFFAGWLLMGVGVAAWGSGGAIPFFLGLGAVIETTIPDPFRLLKK